MQSSLQKSKPIATDSMYVLFGEFYSQQIVFPKGPWVYISVFMVSSQGSFPSAQVLRIGRTSSEIKKEKCHPQSTA